ncbi:M23 family metallopeptidase [Anoxybacterium hadale]|uniref:M23 family metallopeptidase n=1 Tax=Anoxybacterium hadale TaxID=3408580 RepID=A0ACD1AAU3_9FIRM|nr:M23 family metallopeptidase [Clostridiales bacterium]
MNIFERFAMILTPSRKRRKMISYVIVGIVIFFGISIGAVISILTSPAEIRSSLFHWDEIKRADALDGNIADCNGIPIIDSSPIQISTTYPWPLNGTITCQYGGRILYGEDDFHGGIDISTGKNDPVISIADGTVLRVQIDKKSYGLYLLIQHDAGFYTLSAHLAQSFVKEGERVVQGQTIGLEGGEPGVDPYPGRSTGRHLHFEVRLTGDQNSRINPLIVLNQ